MALVIRVTCAGIGLFVEVPFPNSPPPLLPQAQTVPLACTAKELVDPAATLTMLLNPKTRVGKTLSVRLLIPNSPSLFVPHVQTVPSERKAKAWLDPAAMPSVVICPDLA